jgi:hypothetical protein
VARRSVRLAGLSPDANTEADIDRAADLDARVRARHADESGAELRA